MTVHIPPGHETVTPSTHLIQGERVVMPVEIRDASAWAAQFLIPARTARRVLHPVGLEPLLPIPRRAICAVGFVRYVDGDLGPYHEFLISLMAKRPGRRGSQGAYIHWLPVNQTFTCEAGLSIWGFPKILADIAITPGRTHTDCELCVDDRLVMAIRVGDGLPAPVALGSRSIDAYSYRDGVLRRTPWGMAISGVRARPGGARISWGDHEMTSRLRELEIPQRAFLCTSIGKLQMTFEDAEVISGGTVL